MSYMSIAIAAVGVGVVIFIGYLIIGQSKILMPTTAQLNDSNFTSSMQNTEQIIYSGFGLVAVGIIVVAAFGLINMWK